MKSANIHEAKSQLSKLIELALAGEEVVICKAGVPVVKLTIIESKKNKRLPGRWKGKIKVADDFDTLPEDFLEHFESDK